MRRLAFLIAVCAAGVCVAAAPEKQDETSRRAEIRRILEAMLRKAIIPKIEFKDATVREALEFWKRKCVELDAPVNFIVQFDKPGTVDSSPPAPPPVTVPGLEPIPGVEPAPAGLKVPPQPRIQIKRERISCYDLLDEICKQAGLEWAFGYNGIVIRPKALPSKPPGGVKSR